MAWKKIDDYNGSVYVENQPFSAFVAQGLTKNAQAYAAELAQGSSRSFPVAPSAIQWASYGDPIGTLVYVNAGLGGTSVTFTFSYQTATNHERNDRAGILTVVHLGSLITRLVEVPASAAGSTVTIELPLTLGATAGYQVFWFGWQSEMLDSKGEVEVEYVAANTIGLRENGGGAGHYQITSGEKFEAIVFDPDTAPIQINRVNAQVLQLGYLEATTGDRGVGIIFPAIPMYPAGTAINEIPKTSMLATVYELGAMILLGLTYEVTGADDLGLIDQFNHYDALALTRCNSVQSEAVIACRPELANGTCSPFRLGRLVTPSPDAITTTFCVQGPTTASVQVILNVVRCNPSPLGAGGRLRFELDILDKNGASVLAAVVDRKVSLSFYGPPADFFDAQFSFRALTGVYAQNQAWGLRDGVPFSDLSKGTVVEMSTPPINLGSVTAGEVYTVKITTYGSVYVYGYSARLV